MKLTEEMRAVMSGEARTRKAIREIVREEIEAAFKVQEAARKARQDDRHRRGLT